MLNKSPSSNYSGMGFGVPRTILDGFRLPKGYHKNSGITISPELVASSPSIRGSDFAARPDRPVRYPSFYDMLKGKKLRKRVKDKNR